jgi:hypothetical protein
MGNMAEKPTRNKLQEAQRRQMALHRVMTWCLEIQKMHQRLQQGEAPNLNNYRDKISAICLLKDINQAHHIQELESYDPELISEPGAMKLLFFNIYYAELHFNPWGMMTEHMIGRRIQHDGKAIQYSRFPNFLLPTQCLYCGESLDFQTYAETRFKFTKHPGCADAWDKGVRKKHLEAMEAIDANALYGHQSQEVALAFDFLWSSYVELSPLYERDYITSVAS